MSLFIKPCPVFYAPGIALEGNVYKRHVLTSALDALRNKSPIADRLVNVLSKYYDAHKAYMEPLSITHGPVFTGQPMCPCGRCKNSDRVDNAYYGYKPEDMHHVFYTPINYMKDGSQPWMHNPPEIALGHELVHAYHDICGEYLINGHKEEENRTVGLGEFRRDEFTENAIRADYGVPYRPEY